MIYVDIPPKQKYLIIQEMTRRDNNLLHHSSVRHRRRIQVGVLSVVRGRAKADTARSKGQGGF